MAPLMTPVRRKVPTLAPALARLRAEINARWPERDRASDGWLGDDAHAARESQHNPDGWNLVRALDVDKDGINVSSLLKAAIGAPGVWYVIFDGKIWSRTYGWKAKRYLGPNPHTSHVHVSLMLGYDAAFVGHAWLAAPPKPVIYREGDRGPAIARWQRLLGVTADGIFGPATKKAVNAVKRNQGWKPDGLLGPGVRRVLRDLAE